MNALYEYDRNNYAKEGVIVGGVDEAGRGSLFGPVVSAIWVPDYGRCISQVKDSKLLTAKQREDLAPQVMSNSFAYGVEFVSAEEIDTINIYNATKEGVYRAYEKLSIQPVILLLDALFIEKIPHFTKQISLIKGDKISYAIAGASILAKFFRDSYMKKISSEYPQYGLDVHKGYPTRGHKEALNKYGATLLHRKSFRPVREILKENLSIIKN